MDELHIPGALLEIPPHLTKTQSSEPLSSYHYGGTGSRWRYAGAGRNGRQRHGGGGLQRTKFKNLNHLMISE